MCRLFWKLGASSSRNPQGLYMACFAFIGSLKRIKYRVPASTTGGLSLLMFYVVKLSCNVGSGPRPFYHRKRNLAFIVQEAGWDLGPVWTGTKNYTSTGVRSLDRPARSESLYRLRSTGHIYLWCTAELVDRLLQSVCNISYLMLYPCAWFWTLLMSAVSSVPDVSVIVHHAW